MVGFCFGISQHSKRRVLLFRRLEPADRTERMLGKLPRFLRSSDACESSDDCRRQSQDIEDLCNAGTRKSLLSCEFRHGQVRVGPQRFSPFEGEVDGMWMVMRRGSYIRITQLDLGDVVLGIDDRMGDERPCVPAHERHGHKDFDLEPSPHSGITCGAISSVLTFRAFP